MPDYTECTKIYMEAHTAGVLAARDCVPTPMVIGQAESVLSDKIIPGTEQVIDEGPCGFAQINIHPANSRFARMLTRKGIASKSIFKGSYIWVGNATCPYTGGQSMQRKEAYARAFTKVAQKAVQLGFAKSITFESRMD